MIKATEEVRWRCPKCGIFTTTPLLDAVQDTVECQNHHRANLRFNVSVIAVEMEGEGETHE